MAAYEQSLTQSDVEGLVYHHFMHSFRDDDDARSQASENGGHASAENGRKRPRKYENAHPASGMADELKAINCDRSDVALFDNYPSMVLYGIETTLCPAYAYDFDVSQGTRMLAGRQILFLQGEVEGRPQPQTPGVLMKLVQWAFEGKRSQKAAVIRRELTAHLARQKAGDRVEYRDLLDVLMKKDGKLASEFTENARVKHYFMNKYLKFIAPYYPIDDVAELSSNDIQELALYFDPDAKGFPDPTDLMFEHNMQRFSPQSRSAAPLRELDYATWEKLCELREVPVTPMVRKALKTYNTLKTTVREKKSKIMYGSELFGGESAEVAKEVTGILVGYGAIRVEPKPKRGDIYYVRKIHAAEQMIVQGLRMLVENASRMSPTRCPNDTAIAPSVEPCSEQLRMLNYIDKLPVVIIDGMGGAGKTDGCCFSIADIMSEETLFLTYYNSNASNATTRVTSRSHNIHKLMSMHATQCWRSPYYRRDRKASRENPFPEREKLGITFNRCPLEKIKFVIMDEVGVMYDELFAQVLYPLVTCGKLCRLILCGDAWQQTQKREGKLLQDLMSSMRKWNLTFKHHHRFHDERARLFHRNLLAIRQHDINAFTIDDNYCVHVNIRKGLDPALLKRDPEKKKLVTAALREELVKVFRKHDVGDQETTMILARTRAIRDLVNDILKTEYHDVDTRGFVRTQKIIYKRNNDTLEPNLCNNELLVIDHIQDVRVPVTATTSSDKTDSLDQAIIESENVVQELYSTADRYPRDRYIYRRIVCHVRGLPDAKRVIPWCGQHKGTRVTVSGGAVTESVAQGLEGDLIVAIKPSAWEKADTDRLLMMVASRQRKKLILVSPASELVKWMTTSEAPRRTALAPKISEALSASLKEIPVPEDTAEIKALVESEADLYG